MTRIDKEALRVKKENKRAIQYPKVAEAKVAVEAPVKKAKKVKKTSIGKTK